MDTQDTTVDGSFQVLMVWTNQLKNKQIKYTYNVKLCVINMPWHEFSHIQEYN